MEFDRTKSMIWQGVNQNMIKLTGGKLKFTQITEGKPKFPQITGVEFFMKVQNQINFKLQGRNPKKIFYRGKNRK